MSGAKKPLILKIEDAGGSVYGLTVQEGRVKDKNLCISGLVLIKDIIAALLHWQTSL